MTALPLSFKRCRSRQDMARKTTDGWGLATVLFKNRHRGTPRNCDKTERQTQWHFMSEGKMQMTRDLKRQQSRTWELPELSRRSSRWAGTIAAARTEFRGEQAPILKTFSNVTFQDQEMMPAESSRRKSFHTIFPGGTENHQKTGWIGKRAT